MKQAKAPARQFYRGDWKRDTGLQSCSYAARGLWLEMLLLMEDCDPFGHLVISGRVMKAPQIARMTGGETEEVTRLLGELSQAGVYSEDENGAIFCRRMERERLQKVCKKNAQSLSVVSRLAKKEFANSVQTPIACAVAEEEAVVSFGFEKETAIPEALNVPAFRSALAEWFGYRAERRFDPWTLRTIAAKLTEMNSWGPTLAAEAIRTSIANGWQGIFPPKANGSGHVAAKPFPDFAAPYVVPAMDLEQVRYGLSVLLETEDEFSRLTEVERAKFKNQIARATTVERAYDTRDTARKLSASRRQNSAAN